MVFSKSFGYALRSILYIALMQEENRYVQAEEVALNLGVPRHFVGKILKKLAKAKLLSSLKGPCGGFKLNEHTLHVNLLSLFIITDGQSNFKNCALRLQECSALNPCPMHEQMQEIKVRLKSILTETTISHLIKEDRPAFIKSISSEEVF